MPEGKDLVWKGYAIKDVDAPYDFNLIDFEPKKMGDYDVDIAIEACGVCSSDTHTITGGWSKELNIKPLIPGHEAAGVVKNVGSKVTQFKVGDRAGVGAQVWCCLKCENCKNDNENYCPQMTDTYNATYPDGSGTAHGGYSGAIRCHEHWVYPIPDELSFEEAGPMMCGGLTVFSPLVRNGCAPGKKVGIIGIGGLGHFAVKFASALGAEVYAFTHQKDKSEDIKKMAVEGASPINVVVEDKEGKYAEELSQKLDLIICTVDSAEGLQNLPTFTSMLKVQKPIILVGFPDEYINFKPMEVMSNACYIGHSHIGNRKEALRMLKLAAEKGVKPVLQRYPMKEAGKANKMVNDNKVRYRGVLVRDF